MIFVAATNNQHKLVEFKRILEPLGINVITAKQAGVNIGEIEETGKTFEENAKIKAVTICKITGLPSIGDDSGLQVDALNGAPGIYSARYAGKGASDEDKYNLLLENLKGIPDEKRSARFITAIHCAFPNETYVINVLGECRGKIAFEPKGENGFGYDPVFLPEYYNYEKSFAQLSDKQKDKISHRGNALRNFNVKLKLILNEKGKNQ